MSEKKDLWNKLIPYSSRQKFTKNNYLGIFVFRFWEFGSFIEVVIDDLLPVFRNKLLLAHSEDENDFSVALAEKAYAKLNSGYEYLEGGNIEAIYTLCGGIPESIPLKTHENKTDIWNLLNNSLKNHSLITCFIDSETKAIQFMTNGLLKCHSYAITQVVCTKLNKTIEYLILLNNSWGKHEFIGKWSREDSIWAQVSNNFKKRYLNSMKSGDMWINLNDFCGNFSEIVIGHNVSTKIKNEKFIYGQWKKPDRCGGCLNYLDTTFLSNPQFRFDITQKDDEEILISLIQKNRRPEWSNGKINLHVGILVMPIELNRTTRKVEINNYEQIVETLIINSACVSLKHKFSYGRYAIVPHTFEKLEEGEFLLRTVSANPLNLTELESSPKVFINNKMCMTPQCVTRITIEKGFFLKTKQISTFVQIYCEGQTIRSNVIEPFYQGINTIFDWNFSSLFYRFNYRENPISIFIYELNNKCFHKVITLLSKIILPAAPLETPFVMQTDFYKHQNPNVTIGKITIHVESYRDSFRL